MSKRNFEKPGKEKWIMFLSSVLVIGACTVTGVYMNQMSEIKDDGYVVDLSELDTQETVESEKAAEIETTLENAANSDSVLNEESQGVGGAGISEGISEEISEEISEGISPEINTGVKPAAENTGETTPASSQTVTEALHFADTDHMMWPISGDVILNYSMDKTIYFSTLDQYKYNPAIYISSDVGSNVSAAARGTVTEVGSNEEIGQFITMDLGDGYEVTYGELEQINVSTGELVAKGQVIASLAVPTKYYSLEGANLYFKVEKDGTSQNPMNYLK